ncbi:NAD(P)-dependent oxidoreductase [uncultured Pigmentiphaga sp.]|jgi:3-hydroxyisobutyrate dehydrogenase and related beta-hydroxyacid dehydrogenases|uniref:NAD(P)-dependent oxidoreductase n=1 Tax=uncultured Pigmentiphaga sp. TaxID=340361 RepID=UPI002615A8DD|nr:NAD(P)-dependent oxidoreductase [uncultured Pigmentiphaga sp.]
MSTVNAIGLVGLGNAGRALATALLQTRSVVAYDRDSAKMAAFARMGGDVVDGLHEIVRRCEVILLSLPTPQASREVIQSLGELEINGRLVIETSTVSPSDIAWMAEHLGSRGASALDSAIVGGVQRLAEGRTIFLVGASPSDFECAKPILSSIAEEIFHLGEPGAGMRAKLVNNAIAHTTMVTLIEGAALARKAGIPLSVYYTLMKKESGLMRPLIHRFGERIKHQNFEGGMPTDNARKDSALILDLAYELGVPVFTLQASHTVYDIAKAVGLGQQDYASISKLWEQWLDIRMGFGDDD